MAGGSLSGKIIIVTRPKGQAENLASALKTEGAKPVLIPTIRIAPPASYSGLDAAVRSLSSYDAVVFTSGNAVDSFFARARRLRLSGRKPPPPLYAIGPQTAQALRRHGLKAAGVAGIHRGEALARAIRDARGKRILIPRAKAAREALPRELRRRGAKVNVVEAYRTVPDTRGVSLLRKTLNGRVDAVTFTSGSTVREFVALAGKSACRRLFNTAAAASIGPITSAALRLHGIRPAVQAEEATAESLVQSLKAYFNGRRR